MVPPRSPPCARSLRSSRVLTASELVPRPHRSGAAANDAGPGASLNPSRRGVRAAEGARLEIAYASKGVSRVQIPPSPPITGGNSRFPPWTPSLCERSRPPCACSSVATVRRKVCDEVARLLIPARAVNEATTPQSVL
jgi:hypothetical protein